MTGKPIPKTLKKTTPPPKAFTLCLLFTTTVKKKKKKNLKWDKALLLARWSVHVHICASGNYLNPKVQF